MERRMDALIRSACVKKEDSYNFLLQISFLFNIFNANVETGSVQVIP